MSMRIWHHEYSEKIAMTYARTYARQLLVVVGIGGLMLPVLVAGCTLLIDRRERPPSPMMPQPLEKVAIPEGPKVEQVGNASWYGSAQDGKETANGEAFDPNALTAAHPTLPMGTEAVVTNLKTGKSVTVRINDRGPYKKNRKIDLSRAAAQQIGMGKQGVTKVKIESRPCREPSKKTTGPTKKKRAPCGAVPTDPPVLSP